MASFHTATGFINAVEQTLGWPLTEELVTEEQRYKIRGLYARRINAAIKKDAELYTWDNLELAVEYCRKKRLNGKPPMYVLKVVETALANAPKAPPKRPLGERMDAAIAHEMSTQAPGWEDWVGRLARAAGPGRADMHDAWVRAGRYE